MVQHRHTRHDVEGGVRQVSSVQLGEAIVDVVAGRSGQLDARLVRVDADDVGHPRPEVAGGLAFAAADVEPVERAIGDLVEQQVEGVQVRVPPRLGHGRECRTEPVTVELPRRVTDPREAADVDLEQLAASIVRWERDGTLWPGEGIVVGRHEPEPLIDGLRIGGLDEDGRTLVEVFAADERWVVRRRYDDPDQASAYVFDRLGDLVAARHWGATEWTSIRDNVRVGAILRTAVLLLAPEWDLGGDRWDVVDRLRALGLEPDGRYWVDGVDGLAPPGEEVLELRRADDGWWEVGIEERGLFRASGRFSEEADACRRLARDVLTSAAVSMGDGSTSAHVVPAFVDRLRQALDEVTRLVAPDDAS